MRFHGLLGLLALGGVLQVLCGCAQDEVVLPSEPSVGPTSCATDLELFRSTPAAKAPAGAVVDPRDGSSYPFLQAAGRQWFMTNLRFRPELGSTWCPGGSDEGCSLGGRLYDWWAAFQQPASCKDGDCPAWNSPPGRGVCPDGWRIPSQADFDALIASLGGDEQAGTRLKGRSGWLAGPTGDAGSGSDDVGFDAIATGSHAPSDDRSPGGCSGLGSSSVFWTSDRRASLFEPTLSIWLQLSSGTPGTAYYSVSALAGASIRCLRDIP